MAYFRAGICLYTPESCLLEEKKDICDEMVSARKVILDAIHVRDMTEPTSRACGCACPLQKAIEADTHVMTIACHGARVKPAFGAAAPAFGVAVPASYVAGPGKSQLREDSKR